MLPLVACLLIINEQRSDLNSRELIKDMEFSHEMFLLKEDIKEIKQVVKQVEEENKILNTKISFSTRR